jgi:hypothetical protein
MTVRLLLSQFTLAFIIGEKLISYVGFGASSGFLANNNLFAQFAAQAQQTTASSSNVNPPAEKAEPSRVEEVSTESESDNEDSGEIDPEKEKDLQELMDKIQRLEKLGIFTVKKQP